jgi:hypothetical protein
MFSLVRAGLPNTAAILALAIVPLVQLAMSALPERADIAPYCSPSVTLVVGIDTVMEGAVDVDE